MRTPVPSICAADGPLRVPIAATFPMERIRAAVEVRAGRHVHRKIVIDDLVVLEDRTGRQRPGAAARRRPAVARVG
jgi:hypothetical protein